MSIVASLTVNKINQSLNTYECTKTLVSIIVVQHLRKLVGFLFNKRLGYITPYFTYRIIPPNHTAPAVMARYSAWAVPTTWTRYKHKLQ